MQLLRETDEVDIPLGLMHWSAVLGERADLSLLPQPVPSIERYGLSLKLTFGEPSASQPFEMYRVTMGFWTARRWEVQRVLHWAVKLRAAEKGELPHAHVPSPPGLLETWATRDMLAGTMLKLDEPRPTVVVDALWTQWYGQPLFPALDPNHKGLTAELILLRLFDSSLRARASPSSAGALAARAGGS